jgi:UDP-N-acetylglucosamine 3-dehydrogenase
MVEVGVVGLGAMGQHHARIFSELSPRYALDIREPPVVKEAPPSLGGGYLTATKTRPFNRNKSLSEQIKLAGVADANFERAKEIGEKYHIPYYSDYHELIDKVEAVSIAVPTFLHHTVAMDFLKEGVHCLVEKPISFSLQEAQEMIEAAQKHQVNLAVGHIEQFNPAVIQLKQIIDQGSLGELLIVSTRRVGPFVSRILDVGVVIDSAIHDIGVVRHLVGKDPESVYSRVGSLKHSKGDYAVIALDFGTTTACIEVNWFTPHKVRSLVATGSEGVAYLDYIEQKVSVYSPHDNTPLRGDPIAVQKNESLKMELEDFVSSVVSGSKPSVDGVEGMAILRIALKSCESNLCYLH